jgi:subtilisin family serine protease
MGTVVGDDGGTNQIGVAPGAEWIGCRNMEEGWGTPATYIECFEFFLAPYPIGGDPFTEGEPSLAPDVINNSWACPPQEGCEADTLQAAVENVRAAGIMVAISAGNTGATCSSLRNPAGIYDAAFSVGATDSSDNIAYFSARGPVTVDGSGRLKPDISAPGVSVRSSFPGAGYGRLSGTSMAAPHVAGAAALLWSAAPQLVGDVDTTEEILNRAARPQTTTEGCGGDGADDVPNNVYGWGILDALAATPQTWVSVAGRFQVLEGLPVSGVRYTLVLTSGAPISLTDVTISCTIPVSTTLAWAEGDYEAEGGTVRWEIASLPSGFAVSRTLDVALSHPMPGAQLTNVYELHAGGPLVSLGRSQVDAVVPYRTLLFPVLKNAHLRGM